MSRSQMRMIIAFIKDLLLQGVEIEGFHVGTELEPNWISVYIKNKYLPEFAKIKESKVPGKHFIEFQGNIYGIVDHEWVPLFKI